MKCFCQTPIVPATPVASALPTLISANQKITSGPSGHKHLGKCLSRQADVKCKTSEARLSVSDALPDIHSLAFPTEQMTCWGFLISITEGRRGSNRFYLG